LGALQYDAVLSSLLSPTLPGGIRHPRSLAEYSSGQPDTVRLVRRPSARNAAVAPGLAVGGVGDGFRQVLLAR